jgi:hypothetical protein
MGEQTSNSNGNGNGTKGRVRFSPEVTLGNVLQLLTLAAAVIGLWVNLDRRISAVELRETFAVEQRRDLKQSLATLADTQAVMARTVDRLSIVFEQHTKTEGK